MCFTLSFRWHHLGARPLKELSNCLLSWVWEARGCDEFPVLTKGGGWFPPFSNALLGQIWLIFVWISISGMSRKIENLKATGLAIKKTIHNRCGRFNFASFNIFCQNSHSWVFVIKNWNQSVPNERTSIYFSQWFHLAHNHNMIMPKEAL